MNPNESLPSQDRLALFGFGLFETLLISAQRPLFLSFHWQRMKKGAGLLGLKLPDYSQWAKKISAFIKNSSNLTPYALRVTLSGGAPAADLPARLLFHKRPIPYTAAQYSSGIRLHLLSNPRNEKSPLVSIKSANYLENLLAKEEAKRAGCEEGLWLNTQDHLCEGTMSNLFFVKDKQLFTPSLASGCLPGTRRQILLLLARQLEIPVNQGFYTWQELQNADEIFMTNALMGVMPVCQINNILWDVWPQGSENSTMRHLEAAYIELISKEVSRALINPLTPLNL